MIRSHLTAAMLLASASAAAAQTPLPPSRPASVGGGPAVTVPAPEVVKAAPRPAGIPMDAPATVVIERVNAALNRLEVMSADFVQISGNRQMTGQLYLSKPGKLRFDYDAPSPLEIISDGSTVAIRDRKLATQDLYSIGQTPLKFLVRERIDISRDLKVTGVRVDPDRVIVAVEDKATFSGTSQVTLFFDQPSLALRQWTVIDPQGHDVTVTLRKIDTSRRPDPSLFFIDLTVIR